MCAVESSDCEDDWDQDLADDLIGSTLLVGLTYVDAAGALLGRRQVFGTVETVDAREGIVIRTDGEEERVAVAPFLTAIEVGERGLYRLRDQDRTIQDPDFTALFTVTAPQRN